MPSPADFDAAYKKAYGSLNAAQREAVDAVYGPVMVVAGPGTGKTQLLAVRAAHILRTAGDVRPDNLLCLTFTEAGALAMRERLWRFLGPDAARVHVSTFHGWCNAIIRRAPDKFADYRARRNASDVDRFRLLAEILRDLPRKHPLTHRNDPEMYLRACADLISACKRENVSPERLRELVAKGRLDADADESLRYKRASGKNKAGDPKPDYFKQLERLAKNEALAGVYETYLKEMDKRGWYDTDDMVGHALRAFRDHPDLLAEQKERYQFAMVDEYQDTNASQNALIHAMFADEDQPNLLTVGDDDQAIYRFQGANLGNILSFRQIYGDKGLKVVTLKDNYRSGQKILDASRAIARGAAVTLEAVEGLDKTLTAHKPDAGEIKLIPCPTETAELAQAAETLKGWNALGIPWNELAVIARRNSDLLELADALRRAGVPYRLSRGEALLAHPETRKLLDLLRLTWNDDDELLWRALRYDFFKIPTIDVLKAEADRRDKSGRRTMTSILAALVKGGDDAQVELSLFPEGPARRWAQMLADLRAQAANVSPVTFFEWLVENTGYRKYALAMGVGGSEAAGGTFPPDKGGQGGLGRPEGGVQSQNPLNPPCQGEETKAHDRLARLSVLTSLFDLLKSWQADKPDGTIKDFFSYLDDLDRFGLQPDATPLAADPEGVNLLTGHGSKGLEFEGVLMLRTIESRWEKSRSPALLSLAVPLTADADASAVREEKGDDERRLFFVALTRAKAKVAILWAESYTGKPAAPSMFVRQLPPELVTETKCDLSDEQILGATIAVPLPADLTSDLAVRSELSERAARYELSATGLNDWLESPRLFLERHLLREPSAKATAMTFGTAVHAALESAAAAWRQDGVRPGPEKWMASAKRALEKDGLALKDRAKLLEEVQEVVEKYLGCEGHGMALDAVHEQNFTGAFEGLRIKGRFDRVENLPDGTAHVVDYKTGKKKTGSYEEKYLRQLDFYRLLWGLEPRARALTHGVLDYVEAADGKAVARTVYAFDAQRQERLRSAVRAFHKSLQELDFPGEPLFTWDAQE